MLRTTVFLCLLLTLPLWAKPKLPKMAIHRDLRGQLSQLSFGGGSALTWRNPQVGDPGVRSRSGVAEGLALAQGPLDPTKGVVIYIHGWTPTEDNVPRFLYPELWRQHGFNPFIYRWHARAFGDFFQADQQAHAGPVVADLVRQLTLLRNKLDQGKPGSYAGEIRLVGYSEGAYVALQAAKQAFYDDENYAMADWLNHRLRRVDLLEPAFVDEFMRADQVYVGGYQHTRVMTTSEINKEAVGIPRDLDGFGVKVVAFSSALYRNLTPTLDKSMTTQKMHEKWAPEAGKTDIETQHVSLPRYYFASIARPAPPTLNSHQRALSASTPTASLRQGRTLSSLIQVKGTKTVGIGDDAYFEEKTETTRGGVIVDQDPFYQDTIRGGGNAGIVVPLFQR